MVFSEEGDVDKKPERDGLCAGSGMAPVTTQPAEGIADRVAPAFGTCPICGFSEGLTSESRLRPHRGRRAGLGVASSGALPAAPGK
jgi:hypothetical protein